MEQIQKRAVEKRRDQRKCHEGLRASHRLRRGHAARCRGAFRACVPYGKAQLFLPFDMGKKKTRQKPLSWTALALSRHKEVRRSKRELHRETLAEGPSRVAQKVGEEGVETAIAAATGDREGFRYEAADLLYHLLVACISSGVTLNEVLHELMCRHRRNEDK